MWETHPDLDHLEDLWQVFAGLKNSVNLLHAFLGEWLVRHLSFESPELLPSPAEAMPVWCALGLKADLLDPVVNEWRLLWCNDRLLVSSDYQSDPELLAKISDAILGTRSIET